MSAGRHQSDEEPKVIKLKVMIDKTRNRVIFAESDHEFIDTLFSFLTLPLGTVLRLLEKDMVQLGSISRVYASVYSLDPRFLRTSYCKSMLIMPRNSSEVQCEKLKLNVDHSEIAGKLFVCSDYYPCNNLFSISQNTRCCLCDNLMRFPKRIYDKEEKRSSGEGSVVEVFLKGGAASFMVTDDLQVMPASTASLTALFGKLGVSDKNEIEAKTVEVGIKEALQLLKFALLSKMPLTNMVLNNQGNWVKHTSKFENNQTAKLEKKAMSQNSNSMSLKLIVSKSNKKVLYAEAGVKLVDFLFSFLAFPLGAVVKHLGGNSRLGCIDNLYKAAADLSSENYMKSEECKNMLLSPKLFPHSGFDSHILQVGEEYPKYRYGFGGLEIVGDTNKSEGSSIGYEEKTSDLVVASESIESEEAASNFAIIMDPKSPTGETIKGEGYLKGPATFMILDNLLVTPFSPTSIITQLNQMNVSPSDVEERTVIVGKDEALNLLKASLISKTVLNDVFNIREPYPKVMLKV
ncbi:hypothetical protein T459_16221 [Capsicum annuum]|uniref:DUF674 domain-containing protein n=1 Tax=Capsicum annuum TaxID=4072 RepID=A0A2G2Z871_CAPAN|nr:uncharacterized protein LOC107873468 isoform X1 [Capsicum annuum]PHT78169.1 hypothetical protein T459_16221 [Capsicum annuum]